MKVSTKTTSTPFTCHAPEASQVFVSGTFNDWSADATPLKPGSRGKWSVKVALAPGHHEYKFIVDGVWCCEPGCDGPHTGCMGCVPNAFGTMNRFVEVK